MKNLDYVEAMQSPEESNSGLDRAQLAAANINPTTGLASDYLNRFNEAIMLLDLLSSSPDCIDDFMAWRPMSYREHFQASPLKGRDLAIAAYDAADPTLRACLETLAGTMIAVLEATRAAMSTDLPPERSAALAEHAAAWLRPLVARAGAVINGNADGIVSDAPQAVVDGLMKR